MTRNAFIEYDLKKSPYRVTIDTNIFVFSSELHKRNFIERLENFRERVNISLSNRFNAVVNFNAVSDVVLYSKIETRGFLIINFEGREFTCLNQLKLNGENRIFQRQEKQ